MGIWTLGNYTCSQHTLQHDRSAQHNLLDLLPMWILGRALGDHHVWIRQIDLPAAEPQVLDESRALAPLQKSALPQTLRPCRQPFRHLRRPLEMMDRKIALPRRARFAFKR